MRCIDASLSPLVGGAAQAAPTHVIFPYISYSPRSSQFYSLRSCYLFRRSTPRAVLVPRGLAPLCGAHAVAAALYSRRFRSSTVDRFRAGFRSTLSAPFSPYRGPSFLAAIDLTRNLVAAAAASRQQPRPCRLRRCVISFEGNGALPACSAAVLSPTHPHRARGQWDIVAGGFSRSSRAAFHRLSVCFLSLSSSNKPIRSTSALYLGTLLQRYFVSSP